MAAEKDEELLRKKRERAAYYRELHADRLTPGLIELIESSAKEMTDRYLKERAEKEGK